MPINSYKYKTEFVCYFFTPLTAHPIVTKLCIHAVNFAPFIMKLCAARQPYTKTSTLIKRQNLGLKSTTNSFLENEQKNL